jgi:hypothetical protein
MLRLRENGAIRRMPHTDELTQEHYGSTRLGRGWAAA